MSRPQSSLPADGSAGEERTEVEMGGEQMAVRVSEVLREFTDWLDRFGPTSFDHQSFYAGPVGGRAKALYYRQRWLGTAAVAPIIFLEAFVPSARRLFHHPTRFPIAD